MNKNSKLIDLTHTLSSGIPAWDDSYKFDLSIVGDYEQEGFRTQKISCGCSMGTHMDAPAHVVPGARTIEELSLEELVAEGAVIDVSAEADEDYMIMPERVEKFEKEHGKIRSGAFVIFHTGWDRYWEEGDKYNNNHKFPSVHEATAELLLERNICGLGIDTLSADTGEHGFSVHKLILGADKYLVENIANAGKLPPTGVKIFILPMKIKDGTEAPIRMIGLIPN